MVLGVPGGVDRCEHPIRTDPDVLAVGENVHPFRRCGVEPAVEGIEQWPVDERRRLDEAGRVNQVPGALFVDVDGRRRKGPGHVPHPTGMVEVDVRHGHPRQVSGADPECVQRVQQCRHRALAPGLNQHRSAAFDQVAGGHPLPPAQEGVDLDDTGGDLRRHAPTSITTLTSSG